MCGLVLRSTGTLACASFAIVVRSGMQARPTKAHRQECLCYLEPQIGFRWLFVVHAFYLKAE